MICKDCLERLRPEGAIGYQCTKCGGRYAQVGNLKPVVCIKCSDKEAICQFCGSESLFQLEEDENT